MSSPPGSMNMKPDDQGHSPAMQIPTMSQAQCANPVDDSKSNLIINYLPQNLTENELFKMFATVGTVTNCKIMRDFRTGYSYGFGFINYSRPEEAVRAIQTLNGLQIQNKRIKVSYARPPGEDRKETNLYVTNLPRDMAEEELTSLFAAYGNIVQMNLLKDKITGLPRGVAFIRYDRREEAMAAIQGLNGYIPQGRTNPISVKVAEEHGKQKAAYFAGWEAGRQQARIGPEPAGRGHPGQALMGRPPYPPSISMPRPPAGYVQNYNMRQDKSNARYNPIGMGGGYNMYNWN